MLRLLEEAERVAKTDSTVFLQGFSKVSLLSHPRWVGEPSKMAAGQERKLLAFCHQEKPGW